MMWLESTLSIFRSEKLPGAIFNDASFWKEEMVISLKDGNCFYQQTGSNCETTHEFCT